MLQLKNVLVTGGNRGIGLAFVKELAELSPPIQNIFATYRTPNAIQNLQNLKEKYSSRTAIHLLKLDVNNENDVRDAVKRVESVVADDGLNLLINNAGILIIKPLSEITQKEFMDMFSTNAVAPMILSQALIPSLKKAFDKNPGEMSCSRAAIVNISSGYGSIANGMNNVAIPCMTYQMSKAALNMGTRNLARDLKKDGILAVSICPGWVKTDMGTESAHLEPEECVKNILETISKLNETNNGGFYKYSGESVPW